MDVRYSKLFSTHTQDRQLIGFILQEGNGTMVYGNGCMYDGGWHDDKVRQPGLVAVNSAFSLTLRSDTALASSSTRTVPSTSAIGLEI